MTIPAWAPSIAVKMPVIVKAIAKLMMRLRTVAPNNRKPLSRGYRRAAEIAVMRITKSRPGNQEMRARTAPDPPPPRGFQTILPISRTPLGPPPKIRRPRGRIFRR